MLSSSSSTTLTLSAPPEFETIRSYGVKLMLLLCLDEFFELVNRIPSIIACTAPMDRETDSDTVSLRGRKRVVWGDYLIRFLVYITQCILGTMV